MARSWNSLRRYCASFFPGTSTGSSVWKTSSILRSEATVSTFAAGRGCGRRGPVATSSVLSPREWARQQSLFASAAAKRTHPAGPPKATGMLSLDQLRAMVEKDEVDTVIMAFTDCYGRLLGKRYQASFFLESGAVDGSHACNYLLATDMEMDTVEGYESANWEQGYGDYHLDPDLSTLRICSWLEKTALVLCDVTDDHAHELIAHAPRSILKRQLAVGDATGFSTLAATELEYFLYQDDYEQAKEKNYTKLEPIGWHREDYHILQGTREEFFNAKARRHLEASGIPVENSKGEFGHGQHELNIRYADMLEMADRHVIYKQCLKEVAIATGVAVTFMAKPHADEPGSSCHIHLSLWKDGKNAFLGSHPTRPDNTGPGVSDEFRWFLGGWMKHTPDLMPFYAPTINSYKRFVSASWAPTHVTWSLDNRTSLFRIVGKGKSLRIEFRLPGADCNPYLALAACLASGLNGIANKIEPPPALVGSGYSNSSLYPSIPTTLSQAADNFERSEFAKKMLQAKVHKHYLHFYRTEAAKFNQAVTDWEKNRYFELI